VSRPYLNRVSFRLLVYALIANLVYAVGMISGPKVTSDSACGGTTFFYDSCLMFAGIMFFSMALNLQLVLIYGVNGQKMERYYILGAILLTLACNIPPYAGGALGFWDVNQTCWYNSSDPAVQLRWFVGSQAFWLFLMSACEVICFLTIVGFMIHRHHVRSVMSGSVSSSLSAASLPEPPIITYRKMILRIGLYPLFSCFVNITGAILDIHTILDQTYTEVNWRLGIVDLLVYAFRPLMYGILAATDPSFLRALRALRRPETCDRTDPSGVHVTLQRSTNTLSSTSSVGNLQNREAGSKPEAEEAPADAGSVPEFTRQM